MAEITVLKGKTLNPKRVREEVKKVLASSGLKEDAQALVIFSRKGRRDAPASLTIDEADLVLFYTGEGPAVPLFPQTLAVIDSMAFFGKL